MDLTPATGGDYSGSSTEKYDALSKRARVHVWPCASAHVGHSSVELTPSCVLGRKM